MTASMKRDREHSMQKAVAKCAAAGLGCLIAMLLLIVPSAQAFAPSSSLRGAIEPRHSVHDRAGRLPTATAPPRLNLNPSPLASGSLTGTTATSVLNGLSAGKEFEAPSKKAAETSYLESRSSSPDTALIKPTKASSSFKKVRPDGSERVGGLLAALSHFRTISKASLIGANYAMRSSWWCFPFAISLYPLYCLAVVGTPARSPTWWSMPTLTAVVQSPSAELIVAGFLLSNISYFLSGLYLLDIVPRISFRWNKNKGAEKRTVRRPVFSDAPLLGTLTILCGIFSVLYHTFQAIGPHDVAETFYYIDHGFAISSILYFLRLCGIPGKKTMALGGAGLVMLATGSLRGAEAYAWIHSMWHVLSAGASVSWAHDGVKRGGFLGIPPDAAAENESEYAT